MKSFEYFKKLNGLNTNLLYPDDGAVLGCDGVCIVGGDNGELDGVITFDDNFSWILRDGEFELLLPLLVDNGDDDNGIDILLLLIEFDLDLLPLLLFLNNVNNWDFWHRCKKFVNVVALILNNSKWGLCRIDTGDCK